MEKNLTHRLKCLIIDDEETAQYALNELAKTVPWLSVDGYCYSALEAIDVIREGSFDIIFLDIHMPGLSGLDLLELLPPPRAQIIITTAFREYAYEGFRHEVCHFLLKPVSALSFMQAVLKARGQIDKTMVMPVYEPRQTLMAVEPEISPPTDEGADSREMLWIKSHSERHPVWFKDIFAVKGLGDYVKIFYVHGMIVSHGNVKITLAKLPSRQFIRINRSDIINKYAIQKIDGNEVLLINGSKYRIPANKSRDAVINRLTS